MEHFVDHDRANQQINKIKSFINRGFSDAEIAHLMEKEGEMNLKNNSRSWSSNDILEIRFNFGFGGNSELGERKEKIRNIIVNRKIIYISQLFYIFYNQWLMNGVRHSLMQRFMRATIPS